MAPHLLNAAPLAFLAASVGVTVLLTSLLTLAFAWLRPSYPGWRGWAAGQTLLVLGMLIGALRTPETELLSILLGNACVMTGSALVVHAFYRFAGVQVDRRVRLIHRTAVPLILAALYLLTVYENNITARALLVNGYLAVISWAFLRLIVLEMRRQSTLRSAYALNLGVIIVVHALAVPRTLLLGSGTHPEMAFAFNLPNLLMYLSVLLLSVGGTLTFWLLHDDRRRADMQHLQEELSGLAFSDPLTSTLNRRGFQQAFMEWTESARSRAGTLLVLDIDDFKTINDQQVHAAGDTHLRALSTLLHQVADDADLVGRSGGDEFVMLLTGEAGTVEHQLQRLSEGLRGPTGALGFGVSFGCTQVEPTDTLERALNRADQAMYQAKAARRAWAQNIPFALYPLEMDVMTGEWKP
ncbi:GGDEF domain-containing protein, partial [Deinococcus malanensis]